MYADEIQKLIAAKHAQRQAKARARYASLHSGVTFYQDGAWGGDDEAIYSLTTGPVWGKHAAWGKFQEGWFACAYVWAEDRFEWVSCERLIKVSWAQTIDYGD